MSIEPITPAVCLPLRTNPPRARSCAKLAEPVAGQPGKKTKATLVALKQHRVDRLDCTTILEPTTSKVGPVVWEGDRPDSDASSV